MFTQKEATTIAAQALQTHVGRGVAEDFRQKFEPLSSDVLPLREGSLKDPFGEFQAERASRLVHVDSREVLEAVREAVRA